MNEYIKRDTVIGLLDNLIERNNDMAQIELIVAKVNVNAIPAADVEPVVRCKGCENWGRDDGDGFHWCPMIADHTQENFYCAHGKERKR